MQERNERKLSLPVASATTRNTAHLPVFRPEIYGNINRNSP
jgi:hypothetical protein